jgi:hypothetical protein
MRKRVDPAGAKSHIEEASRALAEESAKVDKAEIEDSLKGFLRHSRFANHPRLPDDLERIVETLVKSVDVLETYEHLESSLAMETAELGNRGAVTEDLNYAEKNARSAHRLYVVAKIEHLRWEMNYEPVRAAMRAEATAHLQAEKDAGKRSKQITDADVSAKLSELHPDEWRYGEVRAAAIKLMVSDMEDLVSRWNSRAATLRSILETRR